MKYSGRIKSSELPGRSIPCRTEDFSNFFKLRFAFPVELLVTNQSTTGFEHHSNEKPPTYRADSLFRREHYHTLCASPLCTDTPASESRAISGGERLRQ